MLSNGERNLEDLISNSEEDWIVHSLHEKSNLDMALTTVTMNINNNLTLEWHGKTGNLGINRYIKLPHAEESVPFFEKSILQQLDCAPCLKGMAHRTPLSQSGFVPTQL